MPSQPQPPPLPTSSSTTRPSSKPSSTPLATHPPPSLQQSLSSVSSLTSSSSSPQPPQPQEGDPLWLRVMDTKENQWRFINTVALHELSNQERTACEELTTLAARLETLEHVVAATDRLVRHCRAKRLHEQLNRIAAVPVHRAASGITQLDYDAVARAVIDSSLSTEIIIPNSGENEIDNDDDNDDFNHNSANNLIEEVERFQRVAKRFRETADAVGISQIEASSDALQQLATVTAQQAGHIVDSAAEVKRAADLSELARSSLLTDLVSETASIPVDNVS